MADYLDYVSFSLDLGSRGMVLSFLSSVLLFE